MMLEWRGDYCYDETGLKRGNVMPWEQNSWVAQIPDHQSWSQWATRSQAEKEVERVVASPIPEMPTIPRLPPTYVSVIFPDAETEYRQMGRDSGVEMTSSVSGAVRLADIQAWMRTRKEYRLFLTSGYQLHVDLETGRHIEKLLMPESVSEPNHV